MSAYNQNAYNICEELDKLHDHLFYLNMSDSFDNSTNQAIHNTQKKINEYNEELLKIAKQDNDGTFCSIFKFLNEETPDIFHDTILNLQAQKDAETMFDILPEIVKTKNSFYHGIEISINVFKQIKINDARGQYESVGN